MQRVGLRTVVRFHSNPQVLQAQVCCRRSPNTAVRILWSSGESFIEGEGATSLVRWS